MTEHAPRYTPEMLRGEAAEAEEGHRIEDPDYPNSCCCVAADVECLRGCADAWEAEHQERERLSLQRATDLPLVLGLRKRIETLEEEIASARRLMDYPGGLVEGVAQLLREIHGLRDAAPNGPSEADLDKSPGGHE